MTGALEKLREAFNSASPGDFEPGSFADLAYRALPALIDASDALRDCLDYIDTTYDLDDGDEVPACAGAGQAAIDRLDGNPPSACSLEVLADREFELYDFGEGVMVLDHGRWNTSDPRDYTKIAYVEFEDDAPEADSHKVSFHVRFDAAGKVTEAYALKCDKGQEIGRRGQPKALYKTNIVIWTDYNPQSVELENLAREAQSGDAYCSKQEARMVVDPAADPDWDGNSFFDN